MYDQDYLLDCVKKLYLTCILYIFAMYTLIKLTNIDIVKCVEADKVFIIQCFKGNNKENSNLTRRVCAGS